MSAPLLVVPVGCDSCHEPPREGQLFVNLGRLGRRCARCWHAEGEPTVVGAATVDEVHRAETATRERMLARGGADRHLVRKGVA